MNAERLRGVEVICVRVLVRGRLMGRRKRWVVAIVVGCTIGGVGLAAISCIRKLGCESSRSG